jgi:integrase
VARFVGLNIQSPTLPTKERSVAYIPSKNDIKRIVDYFKDTEYEVAILLTLYGLRRSELMALTLDDLSGNTLTINKAKVEALAGEWITKTTKTTNSTREVIISDELSDKIRKQGFIYRRSVGYLRDLLYKAQSDLDIPHFPLHKMRHFFASYLHDMGYSPKQIQEAGGWKTSKIMETVYQHALDIQAAKQNMASDIASLTE